MAFAVPCPIHDSLPTITVYRRPFRIVFPAVALAPAPVAAIPVAVGAAAHVVGPGCNCPIPLGRNVPCNHVGGESLAEAGNVGAGFVEWSMLTLSPAGTTGLLEQARQDVASLNGFLLYQCYHCDRHFLCNWDKRRNIPGAFPCIDYLLKRA